MKKKKMISIVLVSALFAMALAGCGGKKDAADDGKIKLEFFQNKTEAKASFDELVKKFNDANPNITVTQVNPPDAETVLKTRVAKKDVPDIIGIGATDTYAQLAKSGVFADFSDSGLTGNIQPAYLNMMNKLTGSEKVNGIPFTANASGVIYNKKNV